MIHVKEFLPKRTLRCSVDCKWIDIKTEAIRALGVFNSYDTDLVGKLNFLDNFKALADSAICGNTGDFLSQAKF